jgi:acetyl esterase
MPKLDPDATRVLDLIRASGRPPLETLSPAEARIAYAASRKFLQPDPAPVASVQELDCPGPAGAIRLRSYRGLGTAPEAALPALLFLHGGGWVIGDLDSHDGLCRQLANAAGCAVLSVDYRLGPEHRYPAAVEDAAAALRFVAAQAAPLGLDPQRIAVGGDSAGGNLAAVLGLLGRDGAVPLACLQLLLYPATDMAATMPSYQRITEGFPLVTRTVHWFRSLYIATEAEWIEWRASPLRAASVAGTPPAFVLTVGHDPLCDEGIAYARRLDEEGVAVAHLHLADQMHGFLTMGRIIRAQSMAVAQAAAALRHAFGETTA